MDHRSVQKEHSEYGKHHGRSYDVYSPSGHPAARPTTLHDKPRQQGRSALQDEPRKQGRSSLQDQLRQQGRYMHDKPRQHQERSMLQDPTSQYSYHSKTAKVDSDPPTKYPTGHYERDIQYHYDHPTVSVPLSMKLRDAFIPGLLMIFASFINIMCLSILISTYRAIEDRQVVEMTFAIIVYGVVGVIGIISANRAARKLVVGVAIMATLGLVIAAYQIILNIMLIRRDYETRRIYGLPPTYHFSSAATIVPLVNEVLGCMVFIICAFLLVMAVKVLCPRLVSSGNQKAAIYRNDPASTQSMETVQTHDGLPSRSVSRDLLSNSRTDLNSDASFTVTTC